MNFASWVLSGQLRIGQRGLKSLTMNTRLLAFAIAGLLGVNASAATMPDKELGLLLGGSLVDSDMTGGKGGEPNPTIGLRYAQHLGTVTNFFSDLTYANVNGNRTGVGDGAITTLRGGLEWLFSKQNKFNWFLSGGLGTMSVDTDLGPDFTRPLLSVGIGQAWEVGLNDALRWEVRADQSFGNDTLPNAALTNIQALLGYSWGIGAPLDSDGDGVPDRIDQCPGTPKGAKVDLKGCPIDSDGDGVFDGLDLCTATPAGVKVDTQGCPLDTDGDGVADYMDKCPDTPKGVKVDELGCPVDSDGDGVPDYKDACPTTPASAADGCPPATPVAVPAPVLKPKKLILEGVSFDNDQAVLRPEAKVILDQAAEALKEWGTVKVQVAGYTDSMSGDDYNLKLSQQRAEAVREYLIGKGVAADRLTAKGYGEAMPIADNATEAGRAKNRRVELIPQQ